MIKIYDYVVSNFSYLRCAWNIGIRFRDFEVDETVMGEDLVFLLLDCRLCHLARTQVV